MSKKRLRPAPVKTPAPTTNRTSEVTPAGHSAGTPVPTAVASPAVAIAAIENALAAVREFSAQRLAAKLSVSRLMGVARELKELLKVMSVYGV